MADEKEQIDRLSVIDGIMEPLLLNHCLRRNDFRSVGIPREIVQYTKRHNPQTVCSGKVSVLIGNVLILATHIIVDLNVGRYVSFSVMFRELSSCQVSDIAQV